MIDKGDAKQSLEYYKNGYMGIIDNSSTKDQMPRFTFAARFEGLE